MVIHQNVNGRWIYNVEILQSYDLSRASTGLCVTRNSQCVLESSGRRRRCTERRKRSTDEAIAYKVCDLFIAEAEKTAKQMTGDTKSTLITQAREACVNDILLTDDLSVSNHYFMISILYIYNFSNFYR